MDFAVDLILLLVDDISILVYGLLLFLVFREFVPLRFQNKILWVAEILSMGVLGNVIVFPDEITGTVGSLIGLFPILIIFHKGSWYRKITSALIVYPVMMAVSFLLQDMGQQMWKYVFRMSMSENGEDALFVFMRVLKVPIWYAIYRYVKIWVPKAIRMLTRKMWLILSIISLASFMGIIIIIYKCGYDDSYFAWPVCAATLITSMGCCYLCTYMAKIVRSDMELETARYQKSYYQELENSQQTVRRMRHDMKNHLSVVETLLRDGKYEKAEEYLQGLDQKFVSNVKNYCPDPAVNAVLNAKMQKAREEKTDCEYQVELPEKLPMDDIDLCSLFANTLDNAIEACMKIPPGKKRRITLKARCINGNFSYEIVNTKDNLIREKDGSFVTDKEDSGSHGIGLRSVRQIVSRHGGELEVRYTEDTFQVTVFLPAG